MVGAPGAGYEQDQVFINPDGSSSSVPITWAYNHHCTQRFAALKSTVALRTTACSKRLRIALPRRPAVEAYLQGMYSSMTKISMRPGDMGHYGHATDFRYELSNVANDPRANSSIPTSQFFSEVGAAAATAFCTRVLGWLMGWSAFCCLDAGQRRGEPQELPWLHTKHGAAD